MLSGAESKNKYGTLQHDSIGVFRIVYTFVKFSLKHLCAVCKDGTNFKII